jgi:hypothetical protein
MAGNGIPNYLEITDSTVTTSGDGDFLKAVLKTKSLIPILGFHGAFGYGLVFATDANGLPENVLALTSHVCASDSLEQRNALAIRCKNGIIGLDPLVPASQWHNNEGPDFHAHNLDLMPQTAECVSALATAGKLPGVAALEVDLARTTGAGTYPNVVISPDWPTFALGKKIVVGNVPVAEIGDGANTTPALVVGFEIVPIADGTGQITHLCLANITPES